MRLSRSARRRQERYSVFPTRIVTGICTRLWNTRRKSNMNNRTFCANKALKIFIKEEIIMAVDPKDLAGVELAEGEEITAETLDELSNGKGDDEDE